MLLSDGSFGSGSHRKTVITDMLCQALYDDDCEKSTVKKEEKKEDNKVEETPKRRYKQYYWGAKRMKRALNLDESVEEIMQWDNEKKIDVLSSALSDKKTYLPEVYSKLLIIVSGNLDEAYKMADQTNETDIDADIFHKNSLQINLLKIKGALRERFKPEQIARFGNTHIIYPALSRSSFEKIIEKRIDVVLNSVSKTSGINIKVDKTVYDAIYRNGVFPVQGTRPVFSTISSLFESCLPKFTMACLKAKVTKLELSYEDKHLVGMIKGKRVFVKNEGEIDKIIQGHRNEHKIYKVALHESGHALVYSELFGLFPTQIVANAASDDTNGFIGIHTIDMNRQFLLNQVAALMAGRVAEEMVFGHAYIGAGASSDLQRATAIAAQFVRFWGMNKTNSRYTSIGQNDATTANLDIDSTNSEVERILVEQKEVAAKILSQNRKLLKNLTDYLVIHEKIKYPEYKQMFVNHGKQVMELDAKETLYPRFDELYNKFPW